MTGRVGRDEEPVPALAAAASAGAGAGAGEGRSKGAGVDVGFSDDRFLKRVLAEAQRSGGGAAGDAALRRLQGMGFGPEVAKIALHVTGGDERRALELCMSGLAFTGPSNSAASGARGGDPDAPLVDRVPTTPLRCYICGQRHLTSKSLDIHVKACRRRFEQREAKKPAKERRLLLEESELPDGAESLQQHYEEIEAESAAMMTPKASTASSEAARRLKPPRATASPQTPQDEELLPCEFCKRTFAPDRLDTHRRVCLHRPSPSPGGPSSSSKSAAAPGRRSLPGGASPMAPAPPAAVRAYEAFCSNLERCPGCSRQFRPDVLQAHVRQCDDLRAKREAAAAARNRPSIPGLARRSAPGTPGTPGAGGGGGGGGASSSSSLAAGSSPRPAPASGGRGGAGGRASLGAATAPPRRSRSGSFSAPTPPPAAAWGSPGLAFSPPTRRGQGAAGGGGSCASGGIPVSGPNVAPSATVGQATESSLQSAAALVERGLLCEATAEDEERLRGELSERLPWAEVVGIYQVNRQTHHNMYDALKSTMEEHRHTETPPERELWHGTAWAIVPKILRQGFNRSFAGRHGTLLGVATYFSSDPAYSQRFCDRRGGGRDCTKALLLSRVLVGNYCKGAPTDMEPPLFDADSGERYDSTVDSEDKPSIFAVFRDFQAVPLFLLEFRLPPGAGATESVR